MPTNPTSTSGAVVEGRALLPPLVPQDCLVKDASRHKTCAHGINYGCESASVWVRGGCRGHFIVGGVPVACGHGKASQNETLLCNATVFRSASAGPISTLWAAGSSAALDEAKAVLDTAEWQQASSPSTTVLIGVISGHAARRPPMRCAFARLHPSRGRLLFVVGGDETESAEEADLLRVPGVREFVHYHNTATSNASATGWHGTGSVSSYLKQTYFLQYAARQPEALVARMDDDSFVSLPALLAHAAALAPFAPFYAGVFEWYSLAPARLKSTGHGCRR